MRNLLKVQDNPLSYPILEQFYNDLPKNPYCSSVKDFSYIRAKANASKHAYIQPNHPDIAKWLVIDIDSSLKGRTTEPYYDDTLFFRWLDNDMPMPNFIARNRKNGHVQYFYRLTNPVTYFDKSHSHPMRYLAAIEQALTIGLGADRAFGGNMAKNPLDCVTWDITLTGASSYTLNDLAEYLDLMPSDNKPRIEPSNDSGYGRNCSTFDYVREYAYPIAWQYGYKELFNVLMPIAQQHNARYDTPLSYNELKGIVKSIAKYCTSHKYIAHTKKLQQSFSATQSERVKKRWGDNTSKQQNASKLKSEGFSIRQIADQLNIGKSTVARWLKK